MALKNKIHFDIDTLETVSGTQGEAISTLETASSTFSSHISDANNPHSVTAAQIGAVTSQQLTNAITGVVEAIDWKEMVPTFADLAIEYPEPEQGWTASVAADNITYRYNGSEWVPILGALSPLATANTNGLITKEDFSKLAGIESGAKDDQSAAEVPYNNEHSNLIASNVNSAIDELDLKKLDATALSATIALYPTDTPSDILAPALKLVTSITDPDYDLTAVNISTPAISGQDQPVGRIVSEPGVIVGSPGVITVSTIGQIRKISGNENQNASFYYTISRYDAATQTVISPPVAVSDTTQVVSSTAFEEFNAFALFNNGVFGPNDRLVIDYFANEDGNPGAVFQFQFGGDAPVRTLLPVPVQVIPAPSAEQIILDTTNFDGLLDANDDNVQAALDTLDDHNHDGEYFTKEQLRPVTGDPEEDDLNTFAVLDNRYPTFAITDEIIGGVDSGVINLGSLDGRVTTLEGQEGGGILRTSQATIKGGAGDGVTGWQQLGSSNVYFQNVDVVASETNNKTIDYQENAILFDSIVQSELPPQTMTISSTNQVGAVTLTKTDGAAFTDRFKGIEVAAVTPTGTSFYIVSQILNANQLEMYWQSFSAQPSETNFVHNQQGVNFIRFFFLSTPPGRVLYGSLDAQNNLVAYTVAGQVQEGAFDFNWTIPLDAPLSSVSGNYTLGSSHTLVREFKANQVTGNVFLALALQNTAVGPTPLQDDEVWIAREAGLRKIALRDRETNEIFVNIGATYGEDNFVPFGSGDFNRLKIVAGLLIRQNPNSRATQADWAAAEKLDVSAFNEYSVVFGLSVNNDGDGVEMSGFEITFDSPDLFDGAEDSVFIDFDGRSTWQNFPNEWVPIEPFIKEWAKIRYATTINSQTGLVGPLNESQIQFVAEGLPNRDLQIIVGAVK